MTVRTTLAAVDDRRVTGTQASRLSKA